MVTADSVAMRVWPMACEPRRSDSLRRSAIRLGSPTPLKISIDCPWLSTVASGTLSISHLRAASPSPLVLRMRVVLDLLDADGSTHGLGELLGDLRPGDRAVARHDADLGDAGALAAVDGKARAVRPALAHLGQHGGGEPPQLRLEPGVLQKQTDNAAHA